MKIVEIFDLFLRDIKSKILKITRADHEEHSIHIGINFDNKLLQNIFDVRAKSFRTQISMSYNAHLDGFLFIIFMANKRYKSYSKISRMFLYRTAIKSFVFIFENGHGV